MPAGQLHMTSCCGLRDHGDEDEDVEVGMAAGEGSGVSTVAAISFPNSDTDGECIGTCTGRRALPPSGSVRGLSLIHISEPTRPY